MKYIPAYLLIMVILLTGCGSNEEKSEGLPGMGMGSGMSARHHAVVPEEFTALHSPELSDADIVKGGELYSTFCASCHGDGGMGDGPTAASLDPATAPVAHTSSMLSDGYLYWRISGSIIGYMRALGAGGVVPERAMGGKSYDPAAEAEFHEQMLAQAVDMGLITNAESETFLLVHDALDEYRTANKEDLPQGNVDEMQSVILEALVRDGTIAQSKADDFARIHQLLLDEGLME